MSDTLRSRKLPPPICTLVDDSHFDDNHNNHLPPAAGSHPKLPSLRPGDPILATASRLPLGERVYREAHVERRPAR